MWSLTRREPGSDRFGSNVGPGRCLRASSSGGGEIKEASVVLHDPESGRLNSRFVCPDCASWAYSLPRGGIIFVRAGTLDDTSWLRPTRQIWTRSKQPWVTFADGDEIFEAQPSEEVGPGSR
jgi:hypothetical protein